MRPSGILSRLGGEEFGIILAETDLATAETVAERIRRDVAVLNIEWQQRMVAFKVSIGVVQIAADGTGTKTAMERAARALYRAKNEGRNCVIVDHGENTDMSLGQTTICPGLVSDAEAVPLCDATARAIQGDKAIVLDTKLSLTVWE